MRRPILPVALLAAALLATPAPAAAKGVNRAFACGKAGCRDVTTRLPKGDGEAEQLFGTGSLGAGRPRPHPFVVMRLKMGVPGQSLGTWRFIFVPALGMVRYPVEHGEFHWGTLPADQVAAIRRIIRGVPRWPASRMPADPEPAAATTRAESPSVAVPPDGGSSAPAPTTVALAAGAVLAAAGVTLLRRRARGRTSGW